MWGNISIAFLLAFIATFMVTPYSIKIAKKIGAVDIPKDERRMRRKAIPKLGGIAIVAGFAISFFYLISVMQIEGSIDLFDQNEYLKKIIGIGLGIIIILITGILDDTTTLKPLQKLLGQVLAAIVVVSFGVKIDNINHFHHEIYLSDPRKTDPAKCKTVIRYPVNNEADINAKTL